MYCKNGRYRKYNGAYAGRYVDGCTHVENIVKQKKYNGVVIDLKPCSLINYSGNCKLFYQKIPFLVKLYLWVKGY